MEVYNYFISCIVSSTTKFCGCERNRKNSMLLGGILMTANQIAAAQLRETERANRVREAETERANRTKETETERSNREDERIRQVTQPSEKFRNYTQGAANIGNTVRSAIDLFTTPQRLSTEAIKALGSVL